MQINRFQLDHIGRFEHADIPLAPVGAAGGNVTVFVGNNGAGKTSLLKSLATSLSWFVSRVRSEKGNGNGNSIPELAICNNNPSGSILIKVFDKKVYPRLPRCLSENRRSSTSRFFLTILRFWNLRLFCTKQNINSYNSMSYGIITSVETT
jgi:predicted ATP-binding protein involved in virulence